jgi:hypothetical protein
MDASLGVEVDTMNRNDRGELVIYKLCFSLSQQSSQLSVEVIQLIPKEDQLICDFRNS